jgi:hypothetical protein
MNPTKVRTTHRRLGISIAFFLFVQAMVGMLMSIGRLASVDSSPAYNFLYSVHAGWNPLGSVYRLILGVATAMQGVLGIMIFRSLYRLKKKKDVFPPSLNQPYTQKEETPMRALSFAGDIRPLFRSYDIDSMKEYKGIDLSSYEEVKKRAQIIYGRLSAKSMPCDGPWSDESVQKFKDWMEGGMEP